MYHGNLKVCQLKNLASPTTTDDSLSPTIKWHGNSKFCLVFKGSCLKQINATYTPPNRINFFIVYKLDSWPRDLDFDFTLKGGLFGGVKLAKNSNPDKYVYSCCRIEFDTQIEFSLPDGSVGKNVIIFKADISSSVHINNKGKEILILGKGPTRRLNNITLTAETLYSTNFTRPGIKFCLSQHHNGRNSFKNINIYQKYIS